MVGASELPFRLLCRKYGAQLAYTPMLSSHRLANDAAYRREHRVVEAAAAATGGGATGYDRPLTCHVWANTAEDFVAAAKRAAAWADAVDLNLGCPQRTAYVGHYGSYLTYAEEDRDLVCDMVSAAVGAVPGLPVTVKTRLLDSTRDTVAFCRRLAAAGASAIAVHARHRAGWERTGPGARDGPAHLDQVAAVREALVGGGGPVPAIIANGNTVTWEDVCDNLQSTGADGLMSAEGILDNPALFLPRYGSREERDKQIAVWDLKRRDSHPQQTSSEEDPKRQQKKKRKLLKKLNEIERIEEKLQLANEGSAAAFLSPEEKEKLSAKDKVLRKLIRLEAKMDSESAAVADAGTTADDVKMELRTVSLGSLYDVADDMLQLAMEYLELATAFPVKIRSVIFHVRRMLKTELVKYQLLDDCLSCESMEQVRAILVKMQHYRNNPDSFVYDREKAKQEKEALERKRREEGKRKAYEARMMRKANREGKEDLQYYLKIGAELPTATDISRFKKMPRDQVLVAWKERHSQHCLAFHLDADGCKRGRTCAFLHVEGSGRKSANTFEEKEEIAG
jgi:tRNA-dihydrouridine synthase 1